MYPLSSILALSRMIPYILCLGLLRHQHDRLPVFRGSRTVLFPCHHTSFGVPPHEFRFLDIIAHTSERRFPVFSVVYLAVSFQSPAFECVELGTAVIRPLELELPQIIHRVRLLAYRVSQHIPDLLFRRAHHHRIGVAHVDLVASRLDHPAMP